MALTMITPSSSYATAKQRLPNCAPRHSIILQSDQHAQVFSYRFGTYGCLRRGGSVGYLGHTVPGAYCLAGEERCGVVSDEALAGTVVAYVESRMELSGRQPERVVVRSVSTGRVLHDVSLAVATVQQTMVEEPRALGVVADGKGAVAWSQEDWYARHDGATPPPVANDVYAEDSEGFHALRIGLTAKPGSLKFSGSVLSWTQQGSPQAAQLN